MQRALICVNLRHLRIQLFLVALFFVIFVSPCENLFFVRRLTKISNYRGRGGDITADERRGTPIKSFPRKRESRSFQPRKTRATRKGNRRSGKRGRLNPQSQIREPQWQGLAGKLDIRNLKPKQARMPNSSNAGMQGRASPFRTFGFPSWGFVSPFDIRISD